MRARLSLALLLLVLAALPACASPSDLLFAYTGEEDLPRQVRGMGQLAANPLHPRPRTAPDAPVAHTGLNPFGINVFLNEEVEEWKREESLQMVAGAGFHWIRQEFPWEDIEIHGKGDFEDRRNKPNRSAWEKYDHIVDLAEQYDLEVIARLSNPPAWSRADGDARGSKAPPDDLADWGDYVYAVVSRYRGRVRYYQLWNEPNIYDEWGEQPVDPEGYTWLLCEGYRRAREADPEAVIISGALAPTVELKPGPEPNAGVNEFVFLQRMYDAGAADCFDVLAVNDYMLWSGPTDHRMRPLNINFSRPVYVRDIMVANGDAAKPIWISEMNSNAVPNDPHIEGVGAYGQVTLEQQARYAPLAYQRAMEEWPWVGVVNFWFFKRADDTERNQSWYYFRLVEPDFTPLPVYEAMREYTAGLTPTLYPGYHQEDHWALEYTSAPSTALRTGSLSAGAGGWETVRVNESASQRESVVMLGAYRRATAPGATLRFTFEGASLTLSPGPGTGEIEVSVDGGESRRVALAGEPVRLAGCGRHTVRLTALSGAVTVDSLIVHAPWRPSPWLILGVVTLGLAAVWLLLLRR